MAIQILNKDSGDSWVVCVCDVCQKIIKKSTDGVYVFDMETEGQPVNLSIVHKQICFDLVQEDFQIEDVLMGWVDLDCLPIYLGRNLEINFQKAVERANAMAGIEPENPYRFRTYSDNKIKRLQIPQKLRFQIFKRDGYACRLCGSKDRLEIDHIIPVAKDGDDLDSNLWTLCFGCNRGKGTESL